MAVIMVIRARMNPVDASNVNDEWDADAESVDSSLEPKTPPAAVANEGAVATAAAASTINDPASPPAPQAKNL